MDEPFLAWWLIVLVGLWSISLTIWQCPSFRRETRFWAGLLATIYLGLIFFSFGSSTGGVINSSLMNSRHLEIVGSIATSSIFFVRMFGQIGVYGRRLCYVILLSNNAALCLALGATEIGLGLAAVAVSSTISVVRIWRRTGSVSLPDWLFNQLNQTQESPVTPRPPGTCWLIGLTTATFTLVLMGTVSYALRIESSRVAANPHSSSLPSREFLNRTHVHEAARPQLSAVIEYAFGDRPDVVVLVGAIFFLGLASTLRVGHEDNQITETVISDDKYSP